ncbi:MAG TPA: ABC transporter permease [Cellulomonadaceae bacterium]|nr:ABC transporter permease [Cellulomonadaceae bacterium]
MTVFLESLRLAFSSLRANPLRAVLTILGIVIGVAAVVALTSIGGGSTRAVENRFNAFGTDTITVQTSRFSSNSTPLSASDLAAINATPGVRTTVYTVDTNASVTAGSSTAMETITGTFPQIKNIDHLTVAAGTFFSEFDVAHDLPVAVLGSTAASDLSLAPLRAVGQTINVGGVRFQVIGVLASQGGISFGSVDSSVLVPLGSIEGRLVAFHSDISSIRVQATPAALDTFSPAVESTLRTQHNLSTTAQDDFQIVNASSIASAVSSSTKTLTELMAAIAAISLIVGGIGVANVMLVTVRERTREIGVRRAVGATRRDIVVEFLVYAVVTSITGGILGLGVGIAGAFAGGSALSVSPVFSVTTVTLALVVAAAVGILAGIGPALQASSVEPTMALRYE